MNDDTVHPDIDESIRRTFEAAWADGSPGSIEDVIGDPGEDYYLNTWQLDRYLEEARVLLGVEAEKPEAKETEN